MSFGQTLILNVILSIGVPRARSRVPHNPSSSDFASATKRQSWTLAPCGCSTSWSIISLDVYFLSNLLCIWHVRPSDEVVNDLSDATMIGKMNAASLPAHRVSYTLATPISYNTFCQRLKSLTMTIRHDIWTLGPL